MGPEQDDLLLLPKQDELLLLPEQDDLLLHPEQDELVERAADVAYIVGKLAPWWPTLPAAVSHVLAWPRTDFGIGKPMLLPRARTDQTHILSSENLGSCRSNCTT